MNVGGTLSTSVSTTWNVAVPVLPLESVAVHVTKVEPTLKWLPEAGAQVPGIDPLTASVAEGIE